MNIEEIINIVSNRLEFLKAQRAQAVSVGDLQQVTAIDLQIFETQLTLDQLRTLV